MFIKKTWNNMSAKIRPTFEETELYKPFTEDIKTLFKALQIEHGKCTCKFIVGGKQIGWVFEKWEKCENCSNGKYLLQTWVQVHERKPHKGLIYHYYPFTEV